jgi:acyl carrier protein
MATPGDEVAATVLRLAAALKPDVGGVGPSTPMYAGGLELDSLETARFAAMLEDELGTDPYTEGEVPLTVGDVIGFYG